MFNRKPDPDTLFPGADPDQDCLTTDRQSLEGSPPPLDSDTPWQPDRPALLRWLERLALAVERPVNRFVGATTLNPFYHTDTLAVYLWLLVAATGFFLTFFFQFGFEATYNAIARIEGSLLARIIRAVHRYASGLAMLVTLLHGFRLLFMDRFRGPRWLAWVTGVIMVGLLWLDGVTGYWLVWDDRAQLITTSFVGWLDQFTPWAPGFLSSLLVAGRTDGSWLIIFLILTVHILLFVLLAGLYWLHIVRLKHARFLPGRAWLIGLGVIVLLVSALFPAGMLPFADPRRLPGMVQLDPFYLFYLPIEAQGMGVWLWGGLFLVTAFFLVLPWLPRRRRAPAAPPIAIDKDVCTGCTECAMDCPYNAITMIERTDGKPHKYIAIETPELCTACGVCVGSCDLLAVSLSALPPQSMWRAVETRLARARRDAPDTPVTLVFTCERHAVHHIPLTTSGAGTAQDASLPPSPLRGRGWGWGLSPHRVEVIPLPCVASAQPNLLSRSLELGAADVRVVGCPPDDCSRRQGNLWTELRLTRQRVPRLKRAYAHAPITTFWLAPDTFQAALRAPVVSVGERDAPPTQPGRMAPRLTWRNFVPAFALLAVVYAVVVGLNFLPYRPPGAQSAQVQVVVSNTARLMVSRPSLAPGAVPTWPTRVVIEVDGQPRIERPLAPADFYAGRGEPLRQEYSLSPGTHRVRVWLDGDPQVLGQVVLLDQTRQLQPGEVFLIDESLKP